jgi:hypothetical protein
MFPRRYQPKRASLKFAIIEEGYRAAPGFARHADARCTAPKALMSGARARSMADGG